MTDKPENPRAALLAAILCSCQTFPDPAAPVAIRVSSNPPGAVVELDGVATGKTPCTIWLRNTRACRGVVVVRRGRVSQRFQVPRRVVSGSCWFPFVVTTDRYVTWQDTPLHVSFSGVPVIRQGR